MPTPIEMVKTAFSLIGLILSGLNALFLTAAAAIVAWATWRGVQTWRHELVGRTKWELARRMLRRVYAVRDGIQRVRGWIVIDADDEAALQQTGRDKAEGAAREAVGADATYEVRWTHLQTALSDLDAEALEAEVFWGQGSVVALAPLRARAAELRASLGYYVSVYRGPASQEYDTERFKKAQQIVLPLFGKDEFAEQLSAAIKTAEDFLRPHIKAMAG